MTFKDILRKLFGIEEKLSNNCCPHCEDGGHTKIIPEQKDEDGDRLVLCSKCKTVIPERKARNTPNTLGWKKWTKVRRRVVKHKYEELRMKPNFKKGIALREIYALMQEKYPKDYKDEFDSRVYAQLNKVVNADLNGNKYKTAESKRQTSREQKHIGVPDENWDLNDTRRFILRQRRSHWRETEQGRRTNHKDQGCPACDPETSIYMKRHNNVFWKAWKSYTEDMVKNSEESVKRYQRGQRSPTNIAEEVENVKKEIPKGKPQSKTVWFDPSSSGQIGEALRRVAQDNAEKEQIKRDEEQRKKLHEIGIDIIDEDKSKTSKVKSEKKKKRYSIKYDERTHSWTEEEIEDE